MGEEIYAAAILQGRAITFIPPPARHHDVLQLMKANDVAPDFARQTQGFITDRGRFVDRKEALLIAQAAGQMKPRLPGQYDGPELFSEDLW